MGVKQGSSCVTVYIRTITGEYGRRDEDNNTQKLTAYGILTKT